MPVEWDMLCALTHAGVDTNINSDEQLPIQMRQLLS